MKTLLGPTQFGNWLSVVQAGVTAEGLSMFDGLGRAAGHPGGLPLSELLNERLAFVKGQTEQGDSSMGKIR